MKRLFLYCIVLLTSSSVFSQSQRVTITGKVTDEKHHPLEWVNVTLLTPKDSTFIAGGYSQADGSFSIDAPVMKESIIHLSYIGYCTVDLPYRTNNVGEVVLLPANIELQEAVVTSRRPVYHLKAGTLSTNIQNTLLASAGTGKDILKHIPGIQYTDDGYIVFGKGTPEIYIDNHRVNNNDEIKHLQSKNIEKVEVISNPGVEYDATVKAVIRIKTVKASEQFGVDWTSRIWQGRKASTDQQVDMKFNLRKLSLFTNIYYERSFEKRNQISTYNIYTSLPPTVVSQSTFRNNGIMYGGKMGVNYEFNKKHTIGMSYQLGVTPRFTLKAASNYTVERGAQRVDSINYQSDAKQKDDTHLLNFYYQGELNKLKIDFTSDIVLVNSRTDQLANEVNATKTEKDITSLSKNDNNLYAAKLILTHPVGNGKIMTGTNWSFIRRSDKFCNPQQILPSTNSLVHEKKVAAFAEYSLNVGKLSVAAGIRFEHTSSKYWESDIRITEQGKTYNDWLPHLNIDYSIGEVQSSLNYTAKKVRPSFYELRRSLNYNNEFIYEGGNPLAIPETDHLIEANFLYHWFMFNISYKYAQNVLDFQAKGYDKNPDVAIFTTDNFDHSQNISASLYLSPTIKCWSPIFGVEFSQPFFNIINEGHTKRMNHPLATFTFNNSLKLPRSFLLNLDMMHTTSGNMGASYQKAITQINLGIQRSFYHDALNIQLQLNNIFAPHLKLSLYGEKLTYTKNASPDWQQVMLTIRYSFHPSKTKVKTKHVSDEDIQRIK